MHKKEYIIPIFIPFMGCPHDCTFCNQLKITNYVYKPSYNHIVKQVEDYLNYLPKNDVKKEIAFFGGSFTGLPIETLKEYLQIAKEYKKKNIIQKIRCSTRPDYINEEILDILKSYEVDIIELGIQSLDNDVLKFNQRGHTKEDSIKASKLIKEYGFVLGHQVMPGLYMDSKKNDIDTAINSAKMSPDIVRIYPTLIIKDTKLEKLYNENKYIPLSLEEAIELSSEIYMIYSYKNIKVIRIGLQPTENINYNKDVVSGPFHPSIRQLVEGNIMKKAIEEYVIKYNLSNNIEFICNGRNISIINGNRKENKNYFYKKFNIKFNFIEKNIDEIYIKTNNTRIKVDLDNFINIYVEKKYGGDLKLS